MTESYFLSKLLPTFDEEDDEDEEINMMNDDIVLEKRPRSLAGLATPETIEQSTLRSHLLFTSKERLVPATPTTSASTLAVPVARTPSQPKIVSTQVHKGSLSEKALLFEFSSLVLKTNKIEGPITTSNVYIPKKKRKLTNSANTFVYEPDQVANFNIPMTIPEEEIVQEEIVHVSQDVKNMANPLGGNLEIGKLEANVYKPLELDDWENRVAWDTVVEPASKPSQASPELPSSPDTFFVPTANIKKTKPKFIEPEPLFKNIKKGLWGEFTSSGASPSSTVNKSTTSSTRSSSSTVFKNINVELLKGDWRKCILWDDTTPPEKPFPNQLLLDLNDPAVFPEEITKTQILQATRKRKDAEQQENLDKFNLSNDCYYRTDVSASKKRSSLRSAMVHHSEPALKLTHVKPQVTEEDLSNFHRPRSNFSSGERYHMGPYHKEKRPKTAKKPKQPVVVDQRNENIMKKRQDLSANEGRVVLMEYIEENPLVVSNYGMGTKVKNYYRKTNATENPPKFEDGENVLLDDQDESPFLGYIEPGKSVQALDNNLFRAPLVKHNPAETDFLLVKNGRRMVIREIPALYVVGQIQPKMEVYAPNSRAANAYSKKRLQGYIYREFMKKSVNHRLKISDIMALFPGNSETSIRDSLGDCAEFQRGGADSGWWKVKDQSKLPSEDELRAMVTPEMCCLWESMLAGQYRLQQANVRHHANISPALQQAVQKLAEANNTIARAARRVENELQITPWNLSSNFVATMKGKGLLQLTGFGDPSGQRGEAYSYLKLPQKSRSGPKKKDSIAPKSQVSGKDADLRKLSLENSRLVLLKFGVPDSEIQKLGRWERIALVRKKSSEAAISGEGGDTKFARRTRLSVQEQQHQYKEQVQLIWDRQMKSLTEDVAEFSDDEPNEEDLDLEKFGKDLESSLENKEDLHNAREEEERKEMELLRNLTTDDKKEPDSSQPKRVIKRTVTITHPDGSQERKTEVIRDSKQIEELLKRDTERKRQRLLQGGNPKKSRPALTPEELEEKEKTRKERRRLQEQLRRLKKKQDELKMIMTQGQGMSEEDPQRC